MGGCRKELYKYHKNCYSTRVILVIEVILLDIGEPKYMSAWMYLHNLIIFTLLGIRQSSLLTPYFVKIGISAFPCTICDCSWPLNDFKNEIKLHLFLLLSCQYIYTTVYNEVKFCLFVFIMEIIELKICTMNAQCPLQKHVICTTQGKKNINKSGCGPSIPSRRNPRKPQGLCISIPTEACSCLL